MKELENNILENKNRNLLANKVNSQQRSVLIILGMSKLLQIKHHHHQQQQLDQ